MTHYTMPSKAVPESSQGEFSLYIYFLYAPADARVHTPCIHRVSMPYVPRREAGYIYKIFFYYFFLCRAPSTKTITRHQ